MKRKEEKMKFFDLFAGIGGFRLAFELEGYKCVGFCEIDQRIRELYKAVYDTEGEFEWDDVRTLPLDDVPDFDVLTAGIPCQPFSLVGRREGLKDGRAYPLWSAMFRLIERKRPALCVFENVKGLLSANRGWAFAYLLYKMDSLGYDGEWAVLNSKAFGVPQNRERLFVIFHLRGKSAPKVFPLRESDKVYYKPPKAQEEIHEDSEIAGTLTSRHYTNWEGNFVYDPNGKFKGKQALEKPLQVGYVGKTNSQANRVFSPEGIAPTLLSGGGGRGAKTGLYGIKNGKELKIRRLTPLECFRLQGFPDWVYQKARKTGASDSLLYRAIGNAITVQVAQTIARKLKK